MNLAIISNWSINSFIVLHYTSLDYFGHCLKSSMLSTHTHTDADVVGRCEPLNNSLEGGGR